jgi:hypothetical protein
MYAPAPKHPCVAAAGLHLLAGWRVRPAVAQGGESMQGLSQSSVLLQHCTVVSPCTKR